METAGRLRLALQTLPPPVWEDPVAHLRTDDAVADWRFTDAATMARLRALGTAAANAGLPVLSPDGTITARQAHDVATHWQDGILAGSAVGADWHPAVRARACGFDAADNPFLAPRSWSGWTRARSGSDGRRAWCSARRWPGTSARPTRRRHGARCPMS